MNYEIWVIGFLLFVFAIIDWKFREIPSVFLTSIIFVLAVLNSSNFYYGFLALIYALMLRDLDYIRGIADIKVMVIIGFMISHFFSLAIFMMMVVVYGLIWKLLIRWQFKDQKETAFIPVLFNCYLTLALTSLI